MAEEEIARLTAAVNRFAIQKGWVPNSHDEMVWETWKAFSTGQGHRVSTASSSRCSDEMLPVWEQCSTILNGLLRNGNAYLFSRPVDPKRDGVPNYFEVIKKPMDLGTVKQKLALNARRRHEPLKAAMYKCPSEFKADMDLIWENCFLYNPPGYEAHDMGAALKAEFERRWKALRIEENIRKIHRKSQARDGSGHEDSSRALNSSIGKEFKKRKPGMHDTGIASGKEKMNDQSSARNSLLERRTDMHNNLSRDHHPPHQSLPAARKERGKHGVLGSTAKNNAKVDNMPLFEMRGMDGRHCAQRVADVTAQRRKIDTVSKGGIKKTRAEGGQNMKKGTLASRKANRTTTEGQKVKKLLQSCKMTSTTTTPKEPSSANQGHRQPPREWIPPIERGGADGTSHRSIPSCKPVEKPPPPPPQQQQQQASPEPVVQQAPPAATVAVQTHDVKLQKCIALNEHLQRSLKGLERKNEKQMSDYEARRRLSLLLETINLTPLSLVVEHLIGKDPSVRAGTPSSIDQLEIETVRRALRTIGAANKKSKAEQQHVVEENPPCSKKPPLSCMQRVTSPIRRVDAEQAAKRKRTEDEGCRLATKTPMVSPPSPPWHRRLTHKREVWDNAVGLCGVTPGQDGSDLGLTPRQESNESSWEEAVPDDLEDGEILD